MVWSVANISRVLDLVGAPLTLEILEGLGRGVAPAEALPTGTDPSAITVAVDHLRRFGAIAEQIPATRSDGLSLTPLGARLADAIRATDMFDAPR